MQKVFLIDQPCGIEFSALCEVLGSIDNIVVVDSNWREESRVVSGNKMSAYKVRISKAQIRDYPQQVRGIDESPRHQQKHSFLFPMVFRFLILGMPMSNHLPLACVLLVSLRVGAETHCMQ